MATASSFEVVSMGRYSHTQGISGYDSIGMISCDYVDVRRRTNSTVETFTVKLANNDVTAGWFNDKAPTPNKIDPKILKILFTQPTTNRFGLAKTKHDPRNFKDFLTACKDYIREDKKKAISLARGSTAPIRVRPTVTQPRMNFSAPSSSATTLPIPLSQPQTFTSNLSLASSQNTQTLSGRSTLELPHSFSLTQTAPLLEEQTPPLSTPASATFEVLSLTEQSQNYDMFQSLTALSQEVEELSRLSLNHPFPPIQTLKSCQNLT
ncbi:MAG: hypothetical protein ACPGUD_10070 [Parashewanella sp.]